MATPVLLDTVRERLAQFVDLLAPKHQALIQLSKPYQMRKLRDAMEDWPKKYEEIWGAPVIGGVYLHFNEDDELLYVGMAVCIGRRLNAYYKYMDYPRDQSCRIADEALEAKGASRVRVVKLNDELKFLIPALEWFLIEVLDPPLNKQRRRTKPSR